MKARFSAAGSCAGLSTMTTLPFKECTLYTTLGAVMIRFRLYSRSNRSCTERVVVVHQNRTGLVRTAATESFTRSAGHVLLRHDDDVQTKEGLSVSVSIIVNILCSICSHKSG